MWVFSFKCELINHLEIATNGLVFRKSEILNKIIVEVRL